MNLHPAIRIAAVSSLICLILTVTSYGLALFASDLIPVWVTLYSAFILCLAGFLTWLVAVLLVVYQSVAAAQEAG